VRYKSLQQFFRHCVEEEELEASPLAGMRAPKVEVEPVPVVEDDVLERLIKARSGSTFTDRRDMAMLRVFIDTPCRLAEVTNLRMSDVDLRNQVLTVRGKRNRVRTVPFGEKTYGALDRYLRLWNGSSPSGSRTPSAGSGSVGRAACRPAA
jgi:integrase/recombinase XerC